VFHQARRERDQHGGILRVGFYELLQKRKSFEALTLREELRSFLAPGLIADCLTAQTDCHAEREKRSSH
jgi:hypothetical protein